MARKTETLIRLPEKAKERLKLLAEEKGLSLSETVEQLIFNEPLEGEKDNG